MSYVIQDHKYTQSAPIVQYFWWNFSKCNHWVTNKTGGKWNIVHKGSLLKISAISCYTFVQHFCNVIMVLRNHDY